MFSSFADRSVLRQVIWMSEYEGCCNMKYSVFFLLLIIILCSDIPCSFADSINNCGGVWTNQECNAVGIPIRREKNQRYDKLVECSEVADGFHLAIDSIKVNSTPHNEWDRYSVYGRVINQSKEDFTGSIGVSFSGAHESEEVLVIGNEIKTTESLEFTHEFFLASDLYSRYQPLRVMLHYSPAAVCDIKEVFLGLS